ncbi:hypothetical protein BKA61DRAFT_618493 [Leptodontidium sp. MPI-SDFR-AT-0119]|nr:hypothetical protein BKA61DRAFT_618493 [Leptodontidium sp. MPI-SDFR-AT-0119]
MSSYPFNTGIIFGRANGYVIAPFSYQARGIIFAEWANLFTLCLAPLVAHVFGGAPKPVYLLLKPPLWHERLWQYNPTSILWRYFDGSLQMLERSRVYCLRQPTHHRVRLFSGSTLTTLIITIQGVMAIKTLIDGVGGSYAYTINISSIFYPLAVFGLLRIFAAMWLTDDYLYYGNIDSLRTSTTYASDIASSKDEPALIEVRAQTTMSLLDSNMSFASDRFHRTNSWRGILFRIIYLVPVCCLLAISRHGILQLCFIIWSNRCVFSEGYLLITIVSSLIYLTPMTNINSVNPLKLCLRAPPPPCSFALPAPI